MAISSKVLRRFTLIEALYSGYLWVIIPKGIPREHQLNAHGAHTVSNVHPSVVRKFVLGGVYLEKKRSY